MIVNGPSKDYYVDIDGDTVGPITLQAVANLHRRRKVTDQTNYTYEGASQWYPVAYLRPQFPAHWPKFNLKILVRATAVIGALTIVLAVISAMHSTQGSEERKEFREKIAALKVDCEGSTYDEFRSAELNARACFEANRPFLEGQTEIFNKTMSIAAQVEYFWKDALDYPTVPIIAVGPHDEQLLRRVAIIDPEAAERLRNKSENPDLDTMLNDRDFQLGPYIKKGMALIDQNCAMMLNE
jgi:hypothetical protein